MKKKPNFLIVGAAKAGTTSVAKYLDQHPDVFMPEKKELRFFIADVIRNINPKDPLLELILKHSVLDEEEYFELFDVKEKCAGEASVHYLYHYKQAIPKILNKVGDIPIIIILRNPVDRAISNWQYIRKDYYTFEEALKREEIRKENNYNSFWYYKSLGLYFDQVKAYMDSFSNVKIILFEDLKNDSTLITHEIFEFLNLSKIASLDTNKIYNTRVNCIPKSKFLKLIKDSRIHNRFIKFLKFLSLEELFYTEKSKKIDTALRLDLVQFYKPNVVKLESLINRDLSKWKL
jgi:hypothetical protein